MRVILTGLFLLLCSTGSPRAETAATAYAYILSPKHGEHVSSPVKVVFGLSGLGIAPAGVDREGTGHHHLLVDVELPRLDLPIPSDASHIHFGAGQTETVIDLAPGEHVLRLLVGDTNHIPHDPPIVSAPITITVH